MNGDPRGVVSVPMLETISQLMKLKRTGVSQSLGSYFEHPLSGCSAAEVYGLPHHPVLLLQNSPLSFSPCFSEIIKWKVVEELCSLLAPPSPYPAWLCCRGTIGQAAPKADSPSLHH